GRGLSRPWGSFGLGLPGAGVDAEGVAEVVDVVEVLDAVGIRPAHELRADEVEDDVSEVAGAGDAPGLEDDGREAAELLEGQVADALQELPAGHMPLPLEVPHRVIQRLIDEAVGVEGVPAVGFRQRPDLRLKIVRHRFWGKGSRPSGPRSL